MSRICMIGSGNVGTHLSLAMHNSGHQIVQVFSRNPQHARTLASKISAEPISDLKMIDSTSEIVILAVHDDVVRSVYKQIRKSIPNALLLHTAGSLYMEVFSGHSRYGVLWPVQTLTATKETDMHEVPFAIAGNTDAVMDQVRQLAESISDSVYTINDTQRLYLHLAATFASNFSNHMYTIAERITEAHNVPFDILIPLIRETAEKVRTLSPEEAQTGAAAREDTGTITRHLALLKNEPGMQEIYDLITRSIRISKKQEPKS